MIAMAPDAAIRMGADNPKTTGNRVTAKSRAAESKRITGVVKHHQRHGEPA